MERPGEPVFFTLVNLLPSRIWRDSPRPSCPRWRCQCADASSCLSRADHDQHDGWRDTDKPLKGGQTHSLAAQKPVGNPQTFECLRVCTWQRAHFHVGFRLCWVVGCMVPVPLRGGPRLGSRTILCSDPSLGLWFFHFQRLLPFLPTSHGPHFASSYCPYPF